MKKIFASIFALTLLLCAPRVVQAASSPYLIINFAQMNELPWEAPEEQWNKEVKPKVEKEINGMRDTLQKSKYQITNYKSMSNDSQMSNVQSPMPILGWSTLMEYMNFPMDTASDQSPYAIKTRRILEIAEDLDFPVFLPLNGFQWWDELPELYNWWDPDGTHTDARFFARQNNPEDFKKRFIAGFDPDNQWNVEWQSEKTPMKLNVRNWGGGGFFLAPPPNLVENSQAPLTYRNVQLERLKAIIAEIVKKREQWKNEGKEYLFAGLSIGTEISLNASVTPKDEFKPYGFRSTKDLNNKLQSSNIKSISNNKDQNISDIDRVEVVRRYLEDNARAVTKMGIPKDFIYTHVLGEQDKTDPHYGGVAQAAFNLYSTPGVSLYGYAKNPTGSVEWNAALKKGNNPDWGILEYNAGESGSDWNTGLSSAITSANLIVIYNWDGLSAQALPVLRKTLDHSLTIDHCVIDYSTTRTQKGLVARIDSEDIPSENTSSLPHGIYTSFTTQHCQNGKTVYSQPETFYVPVVLPKDETPAWVRWALDLGLRT